ncbi:RDD family protein [Dyella jiangningensis]|uniref:Transporter n=1 Tax=Dyella jiangningensis TaxID=1379159 RepID=A0A328P580_9GAMM|nr:RDD family protein [Dyella jiangningensis]RAO76483.1 transporter [Dyella jiangningensis]
MEVWIGRDGERHGPYKEVDVRQWLRSGQVSPQDLGWYEGLADWQPLSVLFPDEVHAAPPAFTPPAPPYDAGLRATDASAALTDYAGFWKRVAAYILDALVLWIPNMLLSGMLGANEAAETYLQAKLVAGSDPQLALQAFDTYLHALGPALMAQTVVTWLYFALCESSAWQGTLGKRALGIRVTDLTGARISFLRATGRYFGKLISAFILCFGFLMVAWTQRKQGLHDMLAQTLVLNGRPGEQPSRPTPSSRDQGSLSA